MATTIKWGWLAKLGGVVQPNSGNQHFDRIPTRLRLGTKVNWLARNRSDDDQRLTDKVLIEWVEALLKDLSKDTRMGTKAPISRENLEPV